MGEHYDTDLSKQRFPGIARATLEMSYCNGGVNRDRREADVLDDLAEVLNGGIDMAFDIKAIDTWLTTLDYEKLQIVVDGEESEQQAILTGAPPGTDQLLNEIFDGAA